VLLAGLIFTSFVLCALLRVEAGWLRAKSFACQWIRVFRGWQDESEVLTGLAWKSSEKKIDDLLD
jgi:hypothetical protein